MGIQFYNYSEGKSCEIYCVPLAVRPFERDGYLPENVDAMVEPDITVVCDLSKLDDIGCRGAPDWAVEILSPWTRRHDRFTKFNLYQKAGVREYWIVDPDNKCVQVFVLTDGNYKAADFGGAGNKLSVNVLDGCVIDLSRVFSEQQKMEQAGSIPACFLNQRLVPGSCFGSGRSSSTEHPAHWVSLR